MNEIEASQSRQLVIGVDGGGSKTLALVADIHGQVLGRGVAEPSNYQVVGQEAALTAIETAIRNARAGIPGNVVALCLGIAGAARPADRAIFERWADSHYPGVPLSMSHDGPLALAAGTPAGWGIAVLCGTGAFIYGQDLHGTEGRADGWGYLLGDDGSGYAIGREALRAVARAADGRGPATTLTQAILAHWSLNDPQDLIAHIYQPPLPRAEIAGLAEIVATVAAQGDQVADDLLSAAGKALALGARAVVSKLALPRPIPCALAGSVILNAGIVRESFLRSATAHRLDLNPITSVPEPALGAVWLARRLLNPTQS